MLRLVSCECASAAKAATDKANSPGPRKNGGRPGLQGDGNRAVAIFGEAVAKLRLGMDGEIRRGALAAKCALRLRDTQNEKKRMPG
jgi:hypothetical protein